MEHFTNYQQMIAPAMVWESIERNDAVKMAVSFSWKNEEWLIPAVYPFPGGLVVDVVRKLPFYHLKNRLTIYEKDKNAEYHSPLERLLMDRHDPFRFYPTGHLLAENYVLTNGTPNVSSGIRSKYHLFPQRKIIRPKS